MQVKYYNLRTFLFRYSFLFHILILIISLVSCKSHKKVVTEEIVNNEEIINTVPISPKGKEMSLGDRIAAEAIKWIGTPYGYGHSEKGVATDCSGLVAVIFEEVASIKMPRNSSQQADFCDKIEEKEIKPGDLVFFATGSDKKKVSHVGVMLNRIKFVHASGTKGVIISEMTTPYYKRNFIKYGRVPL